MISFAKNKAAAINKAFRATQINCSKRMNASGKNHTPKGFRPPPKNKNTIKTKPANINKFFESSSSAASVPQDFFV